MKFFTPALYERMQQYPTPPTFRAEWDEACKANLAQIERIRPLLPPGMREFAGQTLHDGQVLGFSQPTFDKLVVDIDTRQNPWGLRGVFRITFSGVREVVGLVGLIKKYWSYEEIDLHPNGGFEFGVLFERHEFRVIAEEFELQELPGVQQILNSSE